MTANDNGDDNLVKFKKKKIREDNKILVSVGVLEGKIVLSLAEPTVTLTPRLTYDLALLLLGVVRAMTNTGE